MRREGRLLPADVVDDGVKEAGLVAEAVDVAGVESSGFEAGVSAHGASSRGSMANMGGGWLAGWLS